MHKLFDFNGDGEVSSGEQAFGIDAILAALAETEAEVKITINTSTGEDTNYENMYRSELRNLLDELREQREDLEDEELDNSDGKDYDEWKKRREEFNDKISEIEDILED